MITAELGVIYVCHTRSGSTAISMRLEVKLPRKVRHRAVRKTWTAVESARRPIARERIGLRGSSRKSDDQIGFFLLACKRQLISLVSLGSASYEDEDEGFTHARCGLCREKGEN